MGPPEPAPLDPAAVPPDGAPLAADAGAAASAVPADALAAVQARGRERDSPSRELTRKRRKGYPSETRVKRGRRFVHGDKELVEKLGRNDPCPCGSARRFKAVLPAQRTL